MATTKIASEELRRRLLAFCDQHYRKLRQRDDTTGSSRRIASGISAARGVIEAAPVGANRFDYLDAVAQALEGVKERLRRDGDDEDGWAPGGVSTALNRVLEERAAFATLRARR